MSRNWVYTYANSTVPVSHVKSVKAPLGHNEFFFKQLKESKLKNISEHGKNQKNLDLENLKKKRARDLAISPAKNIPMNLIMMYMSPNSLQLIPIMMTLMLFVNTLKEIFQVSEKFKNVDIANDYDKVLFKVLYVACNCGNLLVGLWKLNKLGLIPNSSSDWLGWQVIPVGSELSFVL